MVVRIDEEIDDELEVAFAHAIVNVSLVKVCECLQSVLAEVHARGSRVFDSVGRRHITLRQLVAFAAPVGDRMTIVWTDRIANEVLRRMSKSVGQISYVDNYEPMRSRAYIRFMDGEVAFELYDPEEQIRTNIWPGDYLMGGGDRRFASFEDFIECVNDSTIPADRIWTVGRWENESFRNELLELPENQFRWCVRLQALVQPEFIGMPPSPIREALGGS